MSKNIKRLDPKKNKPKTHRRPQNIKQPEVKVQQKVLTPKAESFLPLVLEMKAPEVAPVIPRVGYSRPVEPVLEPLPEIDFALLPPDPKEEVQEEPQEEAPKRSRRKQKKEEPEETNEEDFKNEDEI